MINGAHLLLYSENAEADRAFLRDVLQFRAVDIGHGWLILAMPPAEIAVHPSGGEFVQEHAGRKMLGVVLYLMCDDLDATLTQLSARNVECAPVQEAEWGRSTAITLPSGGSLGLYEPAHPTAITIDNH
jgi:hypothetical protein